MKWTCLLLAACLGATGCSGPGATSEQEPSPPPPEGVSRPAPSGIDLARIDDPAVQSVAAFRVFDNLSYVGLEWVSCWVLETSEGLVLIDSLYGDFVDHALAGLRDLGLDPSDLRYVLVTHGHFDHVGGAARLQREYGARVVMTEADWRMAEAGGSGRFAFEPPRHDLVAADGDELEVGGQTLRFFVTPGHTEGVLSIAFDVFDGGQRHRAFTFGGVGLNFEGAARTRQYLASVDRLAALEGIEVNVPNHASMGRVFERAAALASRAPGDPHPFVDPEGWSAWLPELRAGAEAKLAEEIAAEGGA